MNVTELHDVLATLIKEGEADTEVVFSMEDRDIAINIVSVDTRKYGSLALTVVALEDGDWSGG